MNHIGCPECDDHDDRNLHGYVKELIQVRLLLPLGSEFRKHTPQTPRQETSQEDVKDRNEHKIDGKIENMTLDRRDCIQTYVLHYFTIRM